jgi:hypothetical protein
VTAAGRRRRPKRWLDVGSFALGVLTEALAQLRRRPTVVRAVPRPPSTPVVMDPARRTARPRPRRPPARGTRRPEP